MTLELVLQTIVIPAYLVSIHRSLVLPLQVRAKIAFPECIPTVQLQPNALYVQVGASVIRPVQQCAQSAVLARIKHSLEVLSAWSVAWASIQP